VAGDASLELHLSATNAVRAVALRESGLPRQGIPAGSSIVLHAKVLAHVLQALVHIHVKHLSFSKADTSS
jgi:hypothetical protein